MTPQQLRSERNRLAIAIAHTLRKIDNLNLRSDMNLAARMTPSLEAKVARMRSELAQLPAEPAAPAVMFSPVTAKAAPAAVTPPQPAAGADPFEIPPFLRRAKA